MLIGMEVKDDGTQNEQRQFVKPVCSKLIIDEYIRKLEIELGVLLNNGKNDY